LDLIVGAWISAPVNVLFALGIALLLQTKEGLKTLYHLDNLVKNLIQKVKNETKKQLILKQHEIGNIGGM
jgi:hypothetical protein